VDTIRRSLPEDSGVVANLVCRLLAELSGEALQNPELYAAVSSDLLNRENNYTVFIASTESGECVGMISIGESRAIYSLGKFGIIHELYVEPNFRSKDIGGRLIQVAVEHARESGWSRLEVGTPDAEDWQRTVKFYRRKGFEGSGLKLKLNL